MTKQPLIEQVLRQQISQLDELGNKQLNELLEKLKLQKEKLPPEDHPIIDWGISVIQARAFEKNQLINEMYQELEDKYHSYSNFKRKSGWTELDPNQEYDRQKWQKSITHHLEEIVEVTYSCNTPERAERYARKFREYSSNFCKELNPQISHDALVKGCVDFCHRKIAQINKSKDGNRGQTHTDCYENIINGIQYEPRQDFHY